CRRQAGRSRAEARPAQTEARSTESKSMMNLLQQTFLTFLLTAGTAAGQTTLRAIPPPPDVAAPPSDATKTSSGLATKVMEPGKGKIHPTKTDLVTVHYTGWTTDGKMFDSSVARGRPSTFPLDRVIAGWTEGVQL